jgi:hypothetical protein
MDFSTLSTPEKALLAAQSFNVSRAGGDGFMQALGLADQMSQSRRADQVKQQTGGFLQAVMGGADPAEALAKFPDADQGMAGGFFQTLRQEQLRKEEAARARDERRADATTAFNRAQAEKVDDLARTDAAAEAKAQQVEAARPTIGAAEVMAGTPAWSGAEPASVDETDRGFLAQIAAQPTTAVGRQAARTQMLAERNSASVMDKRESDAATAEARATTAAAQAAANQKLAEDKLAQLQSQFEQRQATAEQLAAAREKAAAAQTQAALAQIELAKLKADPGYIERAAKARASGEAAGTPDGEALQKDVAHLKGVNLYKPDAVPLPADVKNLQQYITNWNVSDDRKKAVIRHLKMLGYFDPAKPVPAE